MEDFLSGVPIEKCKGIELTDTNDEMVVVQASIELVADTFSRMHSVCSWERNVYSREIEVPDCGVLIFQFPKHPWTIIHGFYSLPSQSSTRATFASIGEQEACLLSNLLQTKSVAYRNSDTGSYIGYHLFDKGQDDERFFYTKEAEITVNEEDWAGTYQFQSSFRQLTKEDIGYPNRFVDKFFRSQGIYIPYLPSFWYNFQVGERVILQRVVEEGICFERIDCLAIPVST